jgi:hypothetical protein
VTARPRRRRSPSRWDELEAHDAVASAQALDERRRLDERVPAQIELLEGRQVAQALGKLGQPVGAQVEVAQPGEPADRGRDRAERVVAQVEDPQVSQLAEPVEEPLQLVAAQVQLAQAGEAPIAGGSSLSGCRAAAARSAP